MQTVTVVKQSKPPQTTCQIEMVIQWESDAWSNTYPKRRGGLFIFLKACQFQQSVAKDTGRANFYQIITEIWSKDVLVAFIVTFVFPGQDTTDSHVVVQIKPYFRCNAIGRFVV